MKLTPKEKKKLLATAFYIAFGLWLGFSLSRAQEQEPVPVSFTINYDEVDGGSKILASTGVYQVADGNIINAYVVQDKLSMIILRDERGDVAFDVVIGGVKETFTFNAENSAKGAVIRALGMIGVPHTYFAEAYALISDHPNLGELSALYLAAKRYPDTDYDTDLTIEIAINIREQLRARYAD